MPTHRLAAALTPAIAIVGTALSLGLGLWLHDLRLAEADHEFVRLSDRIEREVQRRLTLPLYGLNGLRGAHEASEAVTRTQFRLAVGALDVDRDYAGVRGFGRIERVEPAGRESWLAAARADGKPDFSIRQLQPTSGLTKYVIRYIEPVERNGPAVGLDVGSEPRRRSAIERAITQAVPALTEPVPLVQDGRQSPGFLLFVPIYEQASQPRDATERRQRLRAVLYSPIVAAELFRGSADAAAGRVDFELHAVTGAGKEELVYSHDGHRAAFDAAGPASAAPHGGAYQGRAFLRERSFDLHGVPFRLRVSSTPAFDQSIDRITPWLIAVGGLLFTVALSGLSMLGARARARAERLAESMTADVRRLAAVARHTQNAVVITGLDRRVTWANEAFERTTGYSVAEAMGRSPGELLQCEATDPAEVARLRAALDAGEAFQGELVNRTKDGRDYWIALEIQPLRDDAGEVTGFMAIESDVTERKRMLQQLQASRAEAARLAIVARSTSNPVLITDRESRIEWVNDAFTRLYGHALDQAVGRTPAELIGGPRTSPRATATLRAAAAAGTGCRVEVVNRTADGRDVWIDTEVQPRLEADGRVTGFVQVQSDITARREADERVASLMRENAALLGTIREQAIVSVADVEGRIVEVNDAFCRISGYSREELLGCNHRVVNSGIQPPAFWAAMWKTISSGKPWRGQICNRAKDGSYYWVDSIIAPFVDAEGRIEKYVSIRHDITQSKRAQQQLAAQRQRLESIIAGTQAGTWEHDLATGEDMINDRYAAMMGYTREECSALIAGDWKALIHPDDLQNVTRLSEQNLSGLSREFIAEYRVRHKDGRWIWVQSRGVVSRRNERGEPLATAGIQIDITERKDAERELSRSRQRLSQIIEGTNVGTWEWNVETGETVFNERWAAICGYSLAELGATTVGTWTALTHPEDLTRSSVLLERHFNDESPAYECEARMRHKDGRWVWVLDRGKLFGRSADGRPRWMSGTRMDITERKLAEAALRESQAVLDRTGRIGGIGGWSFDLDTMALNWSDQTCRIHDLEPGHQPTLEEATSFYTAESRPVIEAAVAHCVQTGESYDLELPFVTARGRRIWVRAMGEAEREGGRADGRIVRLVGAFQDITARRELSEALERQHRLLRNAIEALDEAFVLFDADDRLVMCNTRYREVYAHSADVIVPGTRFEDIIRTSAERGQYPEAVGRIDEWVADRMAVHRAASTARIQRLKDGRTLRIVERRLDDGHIVGFRVDVTELENARRQAEASRLEASEALARLQAIYDMLPVGLTITDPQGNVIDCNPASERILGISKAEHLARQYDSLEWQILREDGTPMPPEEYALVRALNRREAVHDAVMQVVTPTRRVWLSVSAIPADHEGLGVVVGYVDISEQRAQEAALREAKAAAEQASVAKSQFLANMSHEIRTPMNAILGMLTLLRRTELTARQADYAAKTEGAARSLLGLLNDILDFSKVEAGKMVLDPHPFRLDQLMRDLGVILGASVGAKPLEVLFDIDPRVPPGLQGDALRLQQVLINLGGNAIKFTERGEVVVSVQWLAERPEGMLLEFAVRDTGIGIAAEARQRIFAGFTQAEASTTRRFGGTGLGLAISQRLVALMGGTLALQSEPGQGTRFSFTILLPRAEMPAEPARSAAAALRALVVDDNPTARSVLQRQCESLRWSADLAADGAEAIARMTVACEEGRPYDVLLVDWQMPGDDGFETLARMDAGGLRGAATAVLMVTAHGREQLEQHRPDARVRPDAFLVKPVTPSMLLDAVAAARAGQGEPAPSCPATATGADRLRGLRLLLVEDNLNNQQVACELLRDEGAQIEVAGNGAEAVEAVAAADPPFDLVLMDLQMPVMDGYTATGRIRQDLCNTTLPIVAMTANAMSSDRDACLAAGMNDHVGKPFEIDHLVQVIARLCGRDAGPGAAGAPAARPTLPQRVAELAAQAGVELEGALRRMGGNAPVLRRLLDGFLRDAEGLIAEADRALAQRRRAEAARALHTLKGLAATLGMGELAAQAAAGERAVGTPALAAAVSGGSVDASPLAAVGGEFARIRAAVPGLLAAWADDGVAALPEATAPLDAEALRQDLAALAALLADSDMAALDALQAVTERHPGAAGGALDELSGAIGRFDFESARLAAEAWARELST